MRIKERIEELKKQGVQVNLIELARLLWPDAETGNQRNLISKLANGQRVAVKLEFVPIICEYLDCDANYLFNIKQK